MPDRVLQRSFWSPLVVAFGVLILLGLVVLAFSVVSFVHQQHRSDNLTRRIAVNAAETRMTQHAIGCLVKVFVQNQPNLDSRVISVLVAEFPHLPERCP